jgi:flagellar biosynthesis chaperone FliJ
MSNQISWLTPQAAQETRTKLLEALGTENQPGQWMDFMEAVTRLLPEVLSVGAPSIDTIQKSAIGQLGFKSWREMIEAPQERGGLGWNFSAWKAWRRAWRRVQDYPYLRNLQLTSSEVNRLHQEAETFPTSAAELEAWREQKEAQKQERKGAIRDQIANLENQVKALEKERDQGQANNQALRNQVEQLSQRLEALATDLGQANADRTHLAAELKTINQSQQEISGKLEKARKALKRHQGMTRWDHLKRAFGRD